MRARTLLFAVGAFVAATVLRGAGAEGIPDEDVLPPPDASVDRLVAGTLPAHVEFKYFTAANTWREGPDLHLFGKMVVVLREDVLIDVTAAALASKGITLPLPPKVAQPTIVKVTARHWETREIPGEVTCANQKGAWVPSAFTDYGQVGHWGLPRSAFPKVLLFAGSSEAKMTLAQIARKQAAAKELAPSPKPAPPAPPSP